MEMLLFEGEFSKYYRMSLSSFENLVQILGPQLEINTLQSRRRTDVEPLNSTGQVQMTLCWLAGGSYHHVRCVAGVSRLHLYVIIHKVMSAINASVHSELSITFPIDEESIKRMAIGFRSISKENVITGCVGAVDGWLCPIRVPSKHEVARATSFFSGHYQKYGINVQARCDYMSRFTATSINSPGGMGDALAFLRWRLSKTAKAFPAGYYLIGDNAYTQDVSMMTPFNKIELQFDQRRRDTYNFYLSQVPIRIEMAFGLLVNKWRVLKTPLSIAFKNVPETKHCCMCLHNYTITRRMIENESFVIEKEIIAVHQSMESGDAFTFRNTITQQGIAKETCSATGFALREVIVSGIENANLNRPARNHVRNDSYAETPFI